MGTLDHRIVSICCNLNRVFQSRLNQPWKLWIINSSELITNNPIKTFEVIPLKAQLVKLGPGDNDIKTSGFQDNNKRRKVPQIRKEVS